LLEEALGLSVGAHSTTIVTFCLAAFARLELVERDAERAALLLGAADGLRRRHGLRAWPVLRSAEAELTTRVREALGADRYDQSLAAGTRLSVGEAIALASDRSNATIRTS